MIIDLKDLLKVINDNILDFERELFNDLEDIMLKPEIKNKSIKFTTKQESNPLKFYLSNGEQITPRFKEVDFSVEFNNMGLRTYSYLLEMIPLNRMKSIFKKRSLGSIENTNNEMNKNEVKFSFGLSFLRETLSEEELKHNLSEIIRYANSFVALHKEFMEQEKKLEDKWGSYDKKAEPIGLSTMKTDKVRMRTIPYYDNLIFLVTDYEAPNNIILPQKHYMFPEGRMDSVFKRFFPAPCAYNSGRLINALPNSARTHDLETIPGRIKKTYQMFFNEEHSGTERQRITMSQARSYITKFLEIHYETLERSKQKSFLSPRE